MTTADATADIEACARIARTSEAAFFRACFLACTSIRLTNGAFWEKLAKAYSVYQAGGLDLIDKQLRFGYKLRLLQELERYTPLFLDLARHGAHLTLHESLCGVYGLRAIKAGFVTQLTTGS